MEFKFPPRPYNTQNEFRKAGFEFEFAGLEFITVTDLIIEIFGGETEIITRYQQKVKNTEIGDFKLEFDSRFLKEKKYENFLLDIGIDIDRTTFQKKLENIVAKVSSNVVPFEVISPPIPIDQLDKLERFRLALYNNKAEGTKASPFYAFALHINPELPDLKTETIISYLQAFLLLQYWIFEESGVSFRRHHFTSYIDYFPQQYMLTVLNENYSPDLDQLIKLYKKYNPTRNRPLDMFPLFVFLKGNSVKTGVEDPELIKGRPTLHYRLPDCRIDEPEWSLAKVWNYWVIVEELAENKEKMKIMMNDFHDIYNNNLMTFKNKWSKKVKEYLNEK